MKTFKIALLSAALLASGASYAGYQPEGQGHVDIASYQPEGQGHVDMAQARPEGNGHVDMASYANPEGLTAPEGVATA